MKGEKFCGDSVSQEEIGKGRHRAALSECPAPIVISPTKNASEVSIFIEHSQQQLPGTDVHITL